MVTTMNDAQAQERRRQIATSGAIMGCMSLLVLHWIISGLNSQANLVQLHPICLSIAKLLCNQRKCLTVLQNTYM